MRPPQLRSIELLCSLFAHYLQTAEYKKKLADIEAAEAAVKRHGADTIAKSAASSSSSSSRHAKRLTYGGLLEAAQSHCQGAVGSGEDARSACTDQRVGGGHGKERS